MIHNKLEVIKRPSKVVNGLMDLPLLVHRQGLCLGPELHPPSDDLTHVLRHLTPLSFQWDGLRLNNVLQPMDASTEHAKALL